MSCYKLLENLCLRWLQNCCFFSKGAWFLVAILQKNITCNTRNMILVEKTKSESPHGSIPATKRQHSMPNRWFHMNPLTAYGGSEPCNWVWFWPTIPSKIVQYFDCVHASKMIFTIKSMLFVSLKIVFKVKGWDSKNQYRTFRHQKTQFP